MDQDKPLVVTTALPYANGPLHAGTLVGYIFTDIYVRYLRLLGKKVTYCCADDTHGTPIEVNAQKAGISPEEFVKRWFADHQRDFKTFGIQFDSYYTTHSPENQYFAELIFKRLNDRGLIYTKEIEITFCEKCQRTLPDRYVKGKCPKCQAQDQYGDNCEKCSAAYKTVDLIDPYCVICKSPPIRKKSEHFFFKLSECTDFLEDWLTHNKNLQQEVVNQLLPWVRNGLEDWCISRDGPYFGFPIPGAKDKFFYVWLDAPIGYISSLCNFLGKDKDKTANAWNSSNIVHVIGKDITYFHLLFWPAILHHASFKVPNDIVVHGFLTVNSEKMSKSRGTMISAEDLAKKADPEFARFYYASNWSRSVTDLDLNTSDFVERVNGELVSNIANFVYRTLSFAQKNFDSKIIRATDITFETQVLTEAQNVLEHYRNWQFREAVKGILKISSWGNKYFQDHEPWKLIKEDKEKAHHIVSECVNAIKVLSVLLKPLLPVFVSKIEHQLNISSLSEKDLSFNLKDHTLNPSEIIYKKLDSFELVAPESFMSKLNLKVAKIIEAREHSEADKLYILQIDLGSEKRQIVAGMRQHYSIEEITGKNIVVVTNLEPRMLKGELSKGMLLACEEAGTVGLVLAPDASPGEPVGVQDVPQGESVIKYDEFVKVVLEAKDGLVFADGQPLCSSKGQLVTDKVKKGKIR